MQAPTSRLLPDQDSLDDALRDHEPTVVVGLLEDGHGEDLRWLMEQCSEERIRKIFVHRSGRQLSRRSRAFWSLVLGAQQPKAHDLSEELWPL